MLAIEKFNNSYMPEPNSGCWIWLKPIDRYGYGVFSFGGRRMKAHQFAYEFYKGTIPSELEPDHKCRVRCCVNPEHMEPVTHRENTMRGVSSAAINGRKTHCKQGHAYDNHNTRLDAKSGFRNCRACNRIAAAHSRERKRKAKPDFGDKFFKLTIQNAVSRVLA